MNLFWTKLAKRIAKRIGEPDGILILDPTSFPQKGKEFVGVQRQWCGRLGKTDNCQVAIFLAFASGVEFALVDRKLFLPDEWTDDPARCHKAGIPEEHRVKKTRHQQSLEMLDGRGKEFPHAWVAGDDEMGSEADGQSPSAKVIRSTLFRSSIQRPTETC